MLTEERKPITFELPVHLLDLLDQATRKTCGKRKTYQWQIVARALDYYFTTELTWEESKQHALLFRLAQKLPNGSANPIEIHLSVPQALKLRDELTKKLEGLGLKEGE